MILSHKKCVKIAKEVDGKVLDKFIPQIYDEKMLNDVMATYDFKSMIYTLYKQEKLNAQEVIDFSYENGIKVVVIDKEKLNSKFIKELKQRGIYVYVNTYNDTAKIKELLHSWDEPRLKELGLPTSWNKNRPNFNEFMNTEVCGVYRPMSVREGCERSKGSCYR